MVYGAFFWNNWIVSSGKWNREYADAPLVLLPRPSRPGKSCDGNTIAFGRPCGCRRASCGWAANPVVVPVADTIPTASAYRASSSAPGIAAVSVSGSRVLVTPAAEGVATITVSATDPGGAAAMLRFTVAVQDLVTDPAALEALYRGDRRRQLDEQHELVERAPLADWYGVEVNGLGRVGGLRLGGWDEALQRHVGNGLTGSLPAALRDAGLPAAARDGRQRG